MATVSSPPQTVLDEMLGASTEVISRVDIYEADGETLFLEDAPFTSGSITVDQGRDERRMFEMTLDGSDDRRLRPSPLGLWYDKVFKCHRGIRYRSGGRTLEWVVQVGEFQVDQLDEPRRPKLIKVSGRDYTKRLITSKFETGVTFGSGQNIESVVRALALNAGVRKMILPATGKSLGRDFLFERGNSRWEAIKDISISFGYEAYFDAEGFLRMGEQQDPVTAPESFLFRTGQMGNLVDFGKRVNDARLFNQVTASGENTGEVIAPFYTATNTEPDSPTNIQRIGTRTYEYNSGFLTSVAQCKEVAENFLRVMALESFEMEFDSIVFPWLEVGSIVRFRDPDPVPGDPDRYLLSSLSIPLTLGSMSATGKRVTIVTAPDDYDEWLLHEEAGEEEEDPE